MTTDAPNDFKTLYDAAVDSSGLSPVSRAVANVVIGRLLAGKTAPIETELACRIKEAAAAGDIDQIFKLTDRLRQAKADEEAQSAKLREIAGEFTFAELLKAFPSEFNDLVHELGLLALQTCEENLAKNRPRRDRGTRSTSETPVYVITHGGRHIEARKNTGAPKSPGAERAFYEFLGFKVSADGHTLTPSMIPNIAGEDVIATKKNIIEGILAGADYWVVQGYTAKVKEATATT